MTPLTVVKSVQAGSFSFPGCKTIAPSRDRVWEVQRIRVYTLINAPPGVPEKWANYIAYTGLRDVTLQFAGFCAWPVAGAWKNSIQPEQELFWSGCVPPGKSSYEPQLPLTITDSDVVILGCADATDGIGTPAGFTYGPSNASSITMTFAVDVDDTATHERGN